MRNIGLMWLILEVLSKRNGIQSIGEGFGHANVGPYTAIAEHGMHMQIAFHNLIPRHIGKLQGAGQFMAVIFCL